MLVFFLSCNYVSAAEIRVDGEFPGGNIVVERIEEDVVHLRQDLRDTEGWWFYWKFRVWGAEGRSLTFQFAGRNPIGVRGPAVSKDGAQTWAWLGASAVSAEPASFRYAFADDEDDVRFAFAIPYQEADLTRFLKRHEDNPHVRVERLCRTPRGRSVERVHVGAIRVEPRLRALLTARHHACETMASFALEGVLEGALADSPNGRWLREHVEIVAIPFMDKDGVEDGDQGKNRRPHDHGRDYGGASRYRSVAALRKFVAAWSEGKLRLAMDMHCPYLREASDEPGSSERIFFVGGSIPAVERGAREFQKILEQGMQGPLPYSMRHNLPFGTRWNDRDVATRSFLGWASRRPGIEVATLIEIPYANVAGAEVNSESARHLGRDLARAMTEFLRRSVAD